MKDYACLHVRVNLYSFPYFLLFAAQFERVRQADLKKKMLKENENNMSTIITDYL